MRFPPDSAVHRDSPVARLHGSTAPRLHGSTAPRLHGSTAPLGRAEYSRTVFASRKSNDSQPSIATVFLCLRGSRGHAPAVCRHTADSSCQPSASPQPHPGVSHPAIPTLTPYPPRRPSGSSAASIVSMTRKWAGGATPRRSPLPKVVPSFSSPKRAIHTARPDGLKLKDYIVRRRATHHPTAYFQP